jgi:hypothetical protein
LVPAAGAYAGDKVERGHPEPTVFAASVVLFAVFVPFAFSEELINGAFDACWADGACAYERAPWQLLAFDTALTLGIIFGAWRFRERYWVRFSRRKLWIWSSVVVVGNLALDALPYRDFQEQYHDLAVLWFNLLMDVGYLILTAILLAVILGIAPMSLLRRTRDRQEWERYRILLPLLVGTFAAWVGGELWDFGLANPQNWNQQHVGTEFFAQLSQVIPLLLVALAIEANFFKLQMRGNTQRAVTIVTVAMMCLGEILVLSVLVLGDAAYRSLDGWHEFIAFVLGLEAVLVGLATLIWAATQLPPRNGTDGATKEPRSASRRTTQ